jgi:protein-L-isoaspartate(D-aspartate) O-methyltransferase
MRQLAEDRMHEREAMVRSQLAARGIRDPHVLRAFRVVPREAFLPPDLAEFAYHDSPLPIEEGQTISQPYIVALMIQAVEVHPGERVLEIGTGSGYAAAILAEIARSVYTIERLDGLAEVARGRLSELGYANVEVLHADGTLGWPEHAPYDAILVAAAGPVVPEALKLQLAVGGRLIVPVGAGLTLQRLLRVTRVSESEFREEDLGDVRFVPLIGAQGWATEGEGSEVPAAARPSRPAVVAELIREEAEPIQDIEAADLGSLIERVGDARVVLLGEATHGTSEFYRMRARITRELVRRLGFTIVAVEADWPDAARINRYVQHAEERGPGAWRAFARFPTWMWRNREVLDLVEWLREHNREVADPERRVGFFGLDLYSLFTSIYAVLAYLEGVDPAAARIARERYGCLTPWESDPATYGRAVLSAGYRRCEPQVVAMLRDLLERQLDYAVRDGERYLDAVQNARLVANAERYYRIMYYGSAESWNLRDRHMFETLESLLAFHGPSARAVVWEHNSHVGDAAATEMSARGELNVGRLCRERHGDAAFLVGFGTDHGTVAAASDWDGPMQVMSVRPSHPESYERVCHESGVEAFLLHLREPARPEVREELEPARLERAIGVIYRPETELQSHYFYATLPHQFDEYVWFDETRAVTPLPTREVAGLPDTHPFGL